MSLRQEVYTVKVIDNSGCKSKASVTTVVIVNEKPVAVAGPDQELKFVFETQMKACIGCIRNR